MTPRINRLKTWVLIAALGGLFVVIGSFWGAQGAVLGLAIALVFNAAMYWWSGSIAVRTTRSKPVTEQEYPELYRIVRELAAEDHLPMPQIYVSDMMQPNAFATGRNPENAKVAVTKGILQILDERELRGVLAHELSHVKNHDILVSSIAAAIGMSLTMLVRFGLFFGDDSNNNGMLTLVAWILAPLAAGIIQMAVSRSREYQADESGAFLSRDPEALANALRKLDVATKQIPAPATVSPAEAHLFIMNPLTGRGSAGFANLFSTHPPTPDRIARLDAIDQRLRGGSPIPPMPA